jgi:hypothetical protein
MSEMKPLAKVTPSEEVTPEREAYNMAFALACRYFGGRDLVEEMVASNCWLLGKGQPLFTVEMVNIPIYGPTDGVPFSQFEIELNKGEDPKKFATMVEQGAREIIGEITDREYLAWRSVKGMMPRLNRVFEELGIHHEEHKVPPKVLASIEEKSKKAAAKNVTVAAE